MNKNGGVAGRTQFLLSSNGKGQITLQKIDVEEMTNRLRERGVRKK